MGRKLKKMTRSRKCNSACRKRARIARKRAKKQIRKIRRVNRKRKLRRVKARLTRCRSSRCRRRCNRTIVSFNKNKKLRRQYRKYTIKIAKRKQLINRCKKSLRRRVARLWHIRRKCRRNRHTRHIRFRSHRYAIAYENRLLARLSLV